VLAFFVALCVPVFVHRTAFDDAFLRWTWNPSSENTFLLTEEARANQRVVLRGELEIGILAFVGFNACWFLWDAASIMRTRLKSSNST
jgi:hypothetical protein